MSVTFETSPSAVAGFAFTCGHENGVTEHRYGSYSDAIEFLQTELDAHDTTGHLAVCGDEQCAYSRMFVHPIQVDPSPAVNVSGSTPSTCSGCSASPSTRTTIPWDLWRRRTSLDASWWPRPSTPQTPASPPASCPQRVVP